MMSDCWPDAAQTLLLRAALLQGDAGRAAFDEWRARADLDRLDRGSLTLLPLLSRRLVEIGVADPWLPRLEQTYTRAAERNARLMTSTAAAVRTLREADIDSLLLKGLALVVRGFAPLGARPMADADLLVPEDRALAARDALVRAGWQLEGRLDADLLPVRHAVGFRSADGRLLDLHWHVLADCCEPGADADFWRASEPAAIDGVAVRTLCPADLVLHACVHGIRWSLVPPVRWAVDATLVIRAAGGAIDWTRLVDHAERRMLVLPLVDTLRFLRDRLDAPVPDWIEPRLLQIDVPGWARAEYRVKRRRRTPLRQLQFHWFQHRRLRASGTLIGDAIRFPHYVRRRLGPSRPHAAARSTDPGTIGPSDSRTDTSGN